MNIGDKVIVINKDSAWYMQSGTIRTINKNLETVYGLEIDGLSISFFENEILKRKSSK